MFKSFDHPAFGKTAFVQVENQIQCILPLERFEQAKHGFAIKHFERRNR